jgi:small subunit ribosomal protein S33
MATRRLIEHSKEKIQRVAARIFQSAYNETNVPTGRKLLKKAFYGPMLFEDPDDKRRKVKLERMKRRGKGPPKKGEGKRSKKK